MILVTSATGNVGDYLVRRLHGSGFAVRALTRDPARARVPSGVEVVEGDLDSPASLGEVFDGVTGFFALGTTGDLSGVLRTASAAGVKRVVLVSTFLARTHPDSAIGRGSLEAERLVRESDLEETVLRPWEYASNVVAWAEQVRTEGVVRPLRAGLPSPAVHPADIAALAAHALTEPGHAGEVYPLTGPEELTPRDKVRALGEALGRELGYAERQDRRELERLSEQAPDEATAGLMIPGVCSLESPGVTDTVERITGSPARGFGQWAAENVHLFR
ncbi:SDR family oxidoreductase [Actinopolyspora halophila]|uniref:SDR family oxidoreductase n=1 Tax=Actinopolyspora halophila TaxID=1850 RepID=UPI000475A1E5|nr:NAD(P)H-binding protein [Actinopolyspora halophila]